MRARPGRLWPEVLGARRQVVGSAETVTVSGRQHKGVAFRNYRAYAIWCRKHGVTPMPEPTPEVEL